MLDDLAIDSSLLNVIKNILILISIATEFLSVDVKTHVVQTFSDRRVHLGKRNRQVCNWFVDMFLLNTKLIFFHLFILNNIF